MNSHSGTFLARIESELDRLTAEELHILNHRIVDRLRLISYVKQASELARFSLRDRVSFKHNDTLITGTILRLNRRTATVLADSGVEWHVSPSHLSKVARDAR